jgi:peptidoglycan/xylan/chitin deacetylase (PgdA/CDA1 family)
MRFVVIVVAALLSLGLAAFGFVSAQKAAPTTSATAPAMHVASNASAVPALVKTVVAPSPAPTDFASAAATRVAQNTLTQNAPTSTANGAAGATAAATASGGSGATSNIPPCDKPGGMGLSRIVEIDTTGGPGFGFQHFKQYDFLRDKEIVLTFDDGPWPENTPAVLKALADECLKATFFEIGKHATWHPEITKQVIEAGMTVGSHTWSHKDLARNPYAKDIEQAEQEIEMGVSAVHMAANAPIAPFFRFPDLQHTPQLMAYLGERNIAAFSTDIDSRDFKFHKPEQVIKSVTSQLEKRGKGIVLMHDFKHATAEALPELLRQLKAGGYKIVHMVPKQPVTTIPKYDEMVAHEDKLSSNNTRPEASVVRTIGQ